MTQGTSPTFDALPDMPLYGKTIVWTEFGGARHTISARLCKTMEEAEQQVFDEARAWGWTPPKWWQWWRWGDTRP